ncbi:T9SS type A sorting domain-containing protein [Mariniflexile soesokkakense]|uniref:T9SS type A sorting domain-containing protein n=1 Tax=Mariniflexile soesokkakense TaxID=1343160 RepID=A0ABV0AHP5_9FLAO
MKKQLLFLLLCVSISFNGWTQSITAISFDKNPTEVNSAFTVTIKYSTPNSTDFFYLGLELKDAAGNYISGVVEKTTPALASGSDVDFSTSLTVPAGVTPSADLPDGQYYALKVALYGSGWSGPNAEEYPVMTLVASGTLGIDDASLVTEFVLYPNPVSNILSIKHAKKMAIKSLKITNILGKTVYADINTESLNSVDVSNLSTGLYILSVNSGDKTQQAKFFKK